MNRKNAGFTLIEVMIVIAVIGIAAAFTIPTLLDILPRWRAKSAATDLFSNLQRAKMIAIQKGLNCDVVFSVNPAQYQIRYTDMKDGVSTTAVVITVSLSGYGSGVEFRGPPNGYLAFTPPGAALTITFNSRGMLTAPATAGYAYFSAQKDYPELRAASDPQGKKRYYRAGSTSAGIAVLEMARPTPGTPQASWAWE
jgi:prepilin-type N-terminal cleavage/methylation domain-containing protein